MRRDNTINRRLRTEGFDITNIVRENREKSQPIDLSYKQIMREI